MTQLAARLRAHGLPSDTPVVLHTNRRVLVTLTPGGELRVHRGYEAAPDAVVAAIARWARPRTRRADRRLAQRILVAFPVHLHAPSPAAERRPERHRPEDAQTLARLHVLWTELNTRHFDGKLGPVEIRLSRRMRRRLGEFSPASGSVRKPEIAIGFRHLARDGWARATATLLHEMVHQWQSETGRSLRHGREFRDRCAAVGIDGRAMARFGSDIQRYLLPEG